MDISKRTQHAALIRAFDDNELGKLHADLGAMMTAKLLRRGASGKAPLRS